RGGQVEPEDGAPRAPIAVRLLQRHTLSPPLSPEGIPVTCEVNTRLALLDEDDDALDRAVRARQRTAPHLAGDLPPPPVRRLDANGLRPPVETARDRRLEIGGGQPDVQRAQLDSLDLVAAHAPHLL